MKRFLEPLAHDTQRIDIVNTPCIRFSQGAALHSVSMSETPNDRLRLAREKAGYKSAAAFAERHALSESTYRSAENGHRGLRLSAAKQYGPLLGVTWQWLMEGGEPLPSQPGFKSGLTQLGTFQTHDKVEMLPVLGMAEGGPDGWNLWNGEVVQYIRRPDNLIGVNGAYAVYVMGTSMEPRYHAGELAHIHPGKPVTPGAYVLIQKRPKGDGEPPMAVIKRLVKRSGSKVIVTQHSPAKEFELKADEILSIHRVVGSSEA